MDGGSQPSRARTRETLAIVLVGVIVVAALAGYGAIGFGYASDRISRADLALYTVIDHENSISSTSDAEMTRLAGINVTNATPATELQVDRTAADQLVTSAESGLATVSNDDNDLAATEGSLQQMQWLTVLSRGRLDKETARLAHARKALSDQHEILADYAQLGGYFKAFLDANVDLITISNQADGNDFQGALTADGTLKTDAAKGLLLSSAAGLPVEVRQYQVDLQTLANDFGRFLTAVLAGDSATAQTYVPKITAEASAVDGHDWHQIGIQIDAFYKPLIDDYNAQGKLATS